MYKEKIFNVITGEEIWRDYTAAEIAEVKKAEAKAQAAAKAQREIQDKRQAALDKLITLGFDIDELMALGL